MRASWTAAAKGSVAASAAAVGGVYVVYPAVLWTLGRVRPRPLQIGPDTIDTISVVVAAHNEAASIVGKLDDLAAQDLASVTMEIVVASDGSVDDTVALARSHPSAPVVLDLPRGGKAAAMNQALRRVRGEVVVFTDANSHLPPASIAALIRPFGDPDVGGVAGDQQYGRRASGAAQGERSYWSYERLIKRWQSRIGNVVSSTGTLHAIRRHLIDEIPGDVTDDFFLSVGVIERGHRLVFAEDAVAWEEPNDRPSAEYRRRVRIITRGLTGVRHRRVLLDPRRYGWYAPTLFVHKVARRLLAVPMLTTLIGSFVLRRSAWPWRVMWLGQAAFYGLAVVGAGAPTTRAGRNKVFALPGHFTLANLAAIQACWNVVRSHDYVTWTPEREVTH